MYVNPKGIGVSNFSEIVKNQIKSYFSNKENIACNFNSIDVNPILGCVIGINGEKVKTYVDFEKELDHELNHYFEAMCFHIKENNDIKIEKDVLSFLINYYDIDVENQIEFFNNMHTHFFDIVEFRSMCANVYHDIEKYNLRFNECSLEDFYKFIDEFNLNIVPDDLKNAVIFSWVVKKISKDRWHILNQSIKVAFSIKKSNMKKIYQRTKDWLRNLLIND